MSEQPDNFDQLWREAIEGHIASMSANDFQALVARTRPPDYAAFTDPADRQRAALASISAQQQKRPQSQPEQSTADIAALNEQIKAAEQNGDHSRAIALKQQLRPAVDANGYPVKKGLQ